MFEQPPHEDVTEENDTVLLNDDTTPLHDIEQKKAMERQFLQQQIQSLVTNDQRMLADHSKLVCQEHPLYALHNSIFATQHHADNICSETKTVYAGADCQHVEKKRISLSDEVNDAYLQLQQQMGLSSFTQHQLHQKGRVAAGAAAAAAAGGGGGGGGAGEGGEGDEGNTERASLSALTQHYDYGYATHTAAPMNGTGTLSAANSAPYVLPATTSTVKENTAVGRGGWRRWRTRWCPSCTADAIANTTKQGDKNVSTSSSSTSRSVVLSQCVGVCFRLCMCGDREDSGAGVASSSPLRRRLWWKQCVLMVPFGLTVLSILYFFFFYNSIDS